MKKSEFNSAMRIATTLLEGVESHGQSTSVLSLLFRELLTPQEVADLRGVHVRTVHWWIQKGQIPHIKKGKTAYVLRSDAVRFQPPDVGNPRWSSVGGSGRERKSPSS